MYIYICIYIYVYHIYECVCVCVYMDIDIQPVTKYLRLTLVFMWTSTWVSVFQEFLTSINKIFNLGERLDTRLSFSRV